MTGMPAFRRRGFAFEEISGETSWVRTVLTIDAEEAAAFIRRGGVVAFPTETVYGLGANVFDTGAVGKIFEAKRRPADNPLIAHVGDGEQIQRIATEVTESAERFIERFFPGPLTVVLRKTDAVPMIATAGLETIGVRMPRFDIAHRFLAACGVPVVAPSANISGRPSPTTWEAVYEDLNGRIDCILQGGPTAIGLESTVVDCSGEVPVVLRAGSVTIEELREVVPETVYYGPADAAAPRSPGMKHRHYSPRARVVVSNQGHDEKTQSLSLPVLPGGVAFIGMSPVEGEFETVRVCGSVEEYAHSVFEFFRECDRAGITTIVCEAIEETGIGAALMDRLRRAAEV
jgi:L-threonylcarbamoyladenylate synthase